MQLTKKPFEIIIFLYFIFPEPPKKYLLCFFYPEYTFNSCIKLMIQIN